MEKESKREVVLKNGMVLIVKMTRSITFIEGDPWEGRPDETLYIEDTKISFTDPNTKKDHVGTGISELYPDISKNDAEMIRKGAIAKVTNSCLYLSKESHDLIKNALDEVSEETMSPEWKKHFDEKKEKEIKRRISELENIIKDGDNEISHNGKLLNRAQVKKWRINYNNICNEGGDGFIPTRIAQEDYDNAVAELNRIKN